MDVNHLFPSEILKEVKSKDFPISQGSTNCSQVLAKVKDDRPENLELELEELYQERIRKRYETVIFEKLGLKI